MNIEFSDAELVALSKALRFVRFQSEDYDAKEFAGSPHIADVYKRVSEAVRSYYKSKNYRVSDEWPFIETIKGYLDAVKVHIRHVDNWQELDPDQRNSFLMTLLFPYKIQDDTFNELIRFGDDVHSKKP